MCVFPDTPFVLAMSSPFSIVPYKDDLQMMAGYLEPSLNLTFIPTNNTAINIYCMDLPLWKEFNSLNDLCSLDH